MTATAAKNTESEPVSAGHRELYDQVMAPNYAPMMMIPERGEGCRLWDTDGKEYLDFAAGIAVSALGHAHPELCKVLAEQAGKFWHVSNLLTNKPAIDLAQMLCELTFAERVFFANSGAEVNEAALKLARRYAIEHHGEGKTEIIAFDNSFHGRTFFTVCVGGQKKYSDGFGPKPGDITHLPFNDLKALKSAVSDRTCAVILEPVQGEGGVNPVTDEFIALARSLCDQHDVCLIFDEVQIGMGRSGFLYHYQKLGITPDILTSAKGLGGGFPIGAMLTTKAIADSLQVGTHGSTFGGNPMACAVACKVLEIVSDPGLLSAVEQKSALIKAELEKLNQKHRIFSNVRGDGLLLGCELSEKWRDRARDILTKCTEQGLLVLMAGPNVIRLAPPLIISDEDIIAGIEVMDQAISAL